MYKEVDLSGSLVAGCFWWNQFECTGGMDCV